ncbi:MAG TPA: S8/S53 family peptidase [Bacteroidia bacterium]|nr:S8/S53 family peptidase [Bacteroidia bacterium]
MNKLLTLCYFLLLQTGFVLQCHAQQNKYWVRFNTKNGTPYSTSNPSAFLTQRSIDRRTAYNIPVVQSDLPVNPSFVGQVDNIPGVTVHYASKWLNGVVISVSNYSVLAQVKALSFVSDTSKVNRFRITGIEPQTSIPPANTGLQKTAQNSTGFNYGGSFWQNKMLGVDCLHNKGLRGRGICIAVLDVGFSNVDINPLFDSVRIGGRILGTRDFVSGGYNVYDDASHGMSVLSCMAACKPGVMIGSAPEALYWLLRTEDASTETISEEYNWIRGAEFADSVGAHILTTSLGYTTFDNPAQDHTYSSLNGRTAPMSIAANLAARKGMLVFNSAGNEGNNLTWLQHISVPADADSICTTGAVDSLNVYASFSGKGPTFDGRIKPDLVAMGVNAFISWSETYAGPGANGTSFSCPILAGAAACFWQAHRSFNNMDVLRELKNSASNKNTPNNTIGWGLPNVCTLPVGLLEYKGPLNTDFSISPNPFKDELTLNWNENDVTLLDFCVLDVSGQVVFKKNLKATERPLKIELPDLNPGLYMLQLHTSSGTLSTKLLCNP